MALVAALAIWGCLPDPRGRCARDADCASGPAGLFCAEGVCQAAPAGAIDSIPAAAIARSGTAEVRAHVDHAHGDAHAQLSIGNAAVAGESLGGGQFRFMVPGTLAPAGTEGSVPFQVSLIDDLGHARVLDGSLLVDDRAPRLTIDPPPATAVTRGDEVVLRVHAEDLSPVTIHWTAGPAQGDAVPQSDGSALARINTAVAPAAADSLTVDFTASDALGNAAHATTTTSLTRLRWVAHHQGGISLIAMNVSTDEIIATADSSYWILNRATGSPLAEKAVAVKGWAVSDAAGFVLARADDSICHYAFTGVQTGCCGPFARVSNRVATMGEFVLLGTTGTQQTSSRFFATSATQCSVPSSQVADFDQSTPSIAPDGTVFSGALNAVVTARFDGLAWNTPSAAATTLRYRDQGAFRGNAAQFEFAVSALLSEVQVGTSTVSIGDSATQPSAPTLSADNTLFVSTTPSGVVAIRPDNTTWRFTPTDVPTASPTQGAGGLLYVGTASGTIEARSAADGALIWKYEAGSGIRGALAIGCDGLLYAATEAGEVLALVVDHKGLADSLWPKAGHDIRNTGDSRRPMRAADGSCLE